MVKEKEVQRNPVEIEKMEIAKETAEKTKGEPKKTVKAKGSVKQDKAAVTSVAIRPETQAAGEMSEIRMQKEFKKRAGIIRKQMNSIQQSFLIIAFQFHWIKEHEMYSSMGYKNIYEYAEMEYGIGRSSCGNFICIIENFAKRDELGNVVECIAEQYQNFTSSQLVAMIGMSEEGKKRITPDMSVRLINRIRKQEAQARIGTARAFGGTEADKVQNTEGREVPTTVNASVPKDNGNDNTAGKTKKPVAAADTVDAVPDMSGESKLTAAVPVSENSAKMDGAENNRKPVVSADAIFAEKKAEPEAKGKPPHQIVSTLLSFDSYSIYQKELEHIHSLVADVFKRSKTPVTVKIVCEQGIA